MSNSLGRRGFIRGVTLAGVAAASGAPGLIRPLRAQATGRRGPLDGLDSYIEQALTEWKIPGAAVGVVHESQVIYAKGHGVKQFGDPDKVDENTLFQIGSTTKAFTSAALALLAEDGKLRWDDAVVTHLPDFELIDPWITRNLSVRDTVCHRSGYRDYSGTALEVIDADESIRRMRFNPAFDRFRDSYNYSNQMFGVAGRLVEKASGMSWGDFVKRRLYQPLGMKRSGTSPYDFWDHKFVAPTFLGTAPAGKVSRRDARDPNVAMPHTLQDGPVTVAPWQSYDNLAAAGSAVSSAADMGNWLIAHLNGGKFQGREIMKPATVAELHSPQNVRDTSRFPFDEGESSYALGWHRQKYRGEIHLSHGGGILGFPAYAFILPGTKVGVVVLANGRTPTTEDYEVPKFDHYTFHKSVGLWVFDRLLGAPETDWRQHYLRQVAEHERQVREREASLRATRLSNVGPTLPLSAYAGEYTDRTRLRGPVQVGVQGRGLLLRFPGDGAYAADLEHWHRDLFRLQSHGVRFMRGFVDFSIDKNGKIASMAAFGGDFRPTGRP